MNPAGENPEKQHEPFSSVVTIRAQGSGVPLIFIHGVGGVLPEFEPLIEKLDAIHPVYGVISQAFDPSTPALLTLPEMAACYLRDIRQAIPEGPYCLIGFSFGGMVAYELAQQLRAEGAERPHVLMIDSMEMSRRKREAKEESAARRARDFLLRMKRRLKEAVDKPDPFAYLKQKVEFRSHRLFYAVTSRVGKPVSSSAHNPYHVNWFAAVNYAPEPYDETIYLFKARDQFWEPRTPYDLGWGPLAQGGIVVSEVPGDHVSLFLEPSVTVLGRCIEECLQSLSIRG